MEMTLRACLISLVFGRADDGFSRETLVGWLPQVHCRWHMLPETLDRDNIVDRFLMRRIV